MGRKRRRQDYLRAFKQAIAYALREDVDGVIHTGNLFWTKSPPAEIVEDCRELLSRLADAGIPFRLVYGDRDQGLAVLRELREEGLLRRLDAEWQTLGGVAVCGIDAATSPRDLGQNDSVPSHRPRIVCSHDEVAVDSLTDAIGADVDAVLLGNQNQSIDRTESSCRILSPGSPERVLGKWMTESETSGWRRPRRVHIYTVTTDSISVESPRLETRDYEGIVLEADETTRIEDVRNRLDQVDLANKAALLILRGEKGPRSPSRKSIQTELGNRCEMARVYDRRDDIEEATEAVEGTDGSSRREDGGDDQGTRSGQRRGDSATTGSPDSAANSSRTLSGEDPGTARDSTVPDGVGESHPRAEGSGSPSTTIDFTPDELARLDTADGEPPDSAHVTARFERLQTQVEAAFASTAWFDSFTWRGDPGSPYIGPPESEQSQYVWFGLAHETYQPLGKPSGGLQFEFGIDAGSARGFFDRSVICGLYFGPWASDPVVSDIADRLRAHRADLATFLENHPKYILATRDDVWDAPAPDVIADRADALADGFTLTVDLSLDDLSTEGAITEQVRRSICEVLPLYAKLAGVEDPAQVHRPDPSRGPDTRHAGGPAADPPVESPSAAGSDATSTTAADEQENRDASTTPAGTTGSSPPQSAGDLPVVTRDGQDIQANQLSEYYEAIRSMRKVIETVMQLRGADIDPEDLTDPRVQYYVMLDACIGLGDPDLAFTGYGQQHQDRLPFGIREYRHAFGEGDWVTDYHAIAVAPYRNETQGWLAEHTWLKDAQRLVRPCTPDGDHPLPEMVGSLEDLRGALAILDTFPAYPPLPMETGTTERTIPVGTLYRHLFADVADHHLVDVETLSGPGQATGDPITGPVADATPTSQTDAESFLLDYGKLTHLFQRVTPPGLSPIKQALPVFALDWYRSNSGSFGELQDLAKHGCDEPVATFRPRLRDMVHRRFLRDRWNYDYITVFPGHEAGQLSPQLVELAQDAVIETSIIYAPLLERTETTERQRERSREERKEVARDPGATLRARATLDGETVLLLDDICTSGNSLLAGAHLLREAGAGRVIGLTLGFTPGRSEIEVKEIKKPDAFASDIMVGLE